MYIINELQTTYEQDENGKITEKTTQLPPVYKEDYNAALSEFYFKCGYAAISTVDVHAVYIVDIRGAQIKREDFDHTAVVIPST